jgi:hypothetical protein
MRYVKLCQGGILAAIMSCVILAGCDKTLEEKTKVKSGPDGTTVQQERTVQHSDGTITQEKETSTTRP